MSATIAGRCGENARVKVVRMGAEIDYGRYSKTITGDNGFRGDFCSSEMMMDSWQEGGVFDEK